MSNYKRVCLLVILSMAGLFLIANLWLFFGGKTDSGRPYRVEVHRLVRQIEAGEEPSLSDREYVTDIVKQEEGDTAFFSGNSDCVIREINGKLYRFDYVCDAQENRRGQYVLVNVLLAGMAIIVLLVLWYVRRFILSPFVKMEQVPYELSKGNLTIPLPENKNRFFGRFVWGVNLLRENMEQQKERELGLQKEKKTLLLSLSHDIKTPLSAIKLYAKALSKGLYTDREKQREIAESISDKTDEIEGFVAEIIRASREDFLSFETVSEEFYLSELLGEITSYYEEKLKLIHTEFRVESTGDCLLTGDRNRAVEVLQNLMENAIKYGDGKQILLSAVGEDGCRLISVTNTGCTLAEGEVNHIFESFWRGSNAEHKKGSGLGLYICRQLMRKMGGEIFARVYEDEMCVTAVFQEA